MQHHTFDTLSQYHTIGKIPLTRWVPSLIRHYVPGVPSQIGHNVSWFGLVNQISWVHAISPIMELFRDLIKPNKKFFWDENLDTLFHQSKENIADCVKSEVSYFDANKKTCLQTDWTHTGIGYLLQQQHYSCESKLPRCCKDGRFKIRQWRKTGIYYLASRALSKCSILIG